MCSSPTAPIVSGGFRPLSKNVLLVKFCPMVSVAAFAEIDQVKAAVVAMAIEVKVL
jgi:hypothetical protein